jgi:ABC-type Mn2+/Zn2+ transport system permease subunit
MKFNWLVCVILDGICGLVILSYLYSLLFGPIKRGTVNNSSLWIVIIVLCVLIPLLFHLCIKPFWYYYVDEKGIATLPQKASRL